MSRKKGIIQPKYDEFAKFNLERKEIAVEIIKAVLPKELVGLCDFERMELVPSEHIDEELRKLINDVLWRLPLKGTDKEIYAYTLIEHESNLKSHELIAFRFHKYVIRAMQKHLDRGHDKLPIIIPILLYHGTTKKYPHSVSIFECFEDVKLAQKYAFRDIELIDLTVMSDEDIAKQGFRFFFEVVLKYARDKDLAERLVNVLVKHPEFARYFEHKEFKKAFVNLLMSLDLDSEKVASETLKQLDNLTGVDIMTLRQQWEAKAKDQGLQQGAILKAQETARTMLADGISVDMVGKYTSLDRDTVLKLKSAVDSKTQH